MKHESKKTIQRFDATHGRMLTYLYQYPFQTLEDLEVALLPWVHRSTIATHLQELVEYRLLEKVVLAGMWGAYLYYLAPLGVTWCFVQQDERESLPDPKDPIIWQ